MHRTYLLAIIAAVLICSCATPPRQTTMTTPPRKGVLLESLTWIEAESKLRSNAVVVLPLGAAAKEHGPHLLLQNDFLIAEYLKQRVLTESDVVVAPTLNYNYYPAFLEYPGSTSLRLETARDVVVDIVKSLAAHGPRRFYVLNTGISTRRALKPAAEMLAQEGILLRYTELNVVLGDVEKQIARQEGGSHADEIETSMMLVIAPETVNMSKPVKDYDANDDKPGMSRTKDGAGSYSPSGVWGDPTLATRDKGVKIVEALLRGVLADIEVTRSMPLPERTTQPSL
jgi:creatinine amidohydrolase